MDPDSMRTFAIWLHKEMESMKQRSTDEESDYELPKKGDLKKKEDPKK